MSYRAPVADIAFALKHAVGLFGRAGGRALWRTRRGDRRRRAGRSRQVRHRHDRAAQYRRRQVRHAVQGRQGDDPARLEGGLHRLGRRRLERPRRAGRLRRPGAAARGQRRLCRDVECGVDGLRHRPGADHGGDRRAACLRHGRAQAALSRQAGERRMDGHHAAHRAAGRLRRRRAAHEGHARCRRQLSHHRLENFHYLRRARLDRQHHPLRAGAVARCAGRHQRHLAVSDSEVHAGRHAQRRARAFGRAQARHPCLAHLHHGLWRPGGAAGYPHRRGAQGHGGDVHHDEPRPPRRRPAGRRHRRARVAAGDRVCERTQAGRRRHHHPLSRRQAHAAHHARLDRRGARHLLRHRRRHRPLAAREKRERAQGRRTSAPRC